QLPLRRLDLGEIVLNPKIDEYAEEEDLEEAGALETNRPKLGWQVFLRAVPYLEELYLYNRLQTKHLAAFAKLLPNLCLIALHSISPNKAEEVPSIMTSSAAAQPVTIRYNDEPYWSFSSNEKAKLNLAKQTHNIWPNAKFEANPASYLAEQNQRVANVLNEFMQELRQAESDAQVAIN
ncbi:hypothetical protein FRC07_012102, partial [Ceratobasidium sp. 392]